MSEITGFCYFPLKNYQEFFVIQGSNSGAPTCWVLISRLSCSPSPKVVLLFYFLFFVSSSFLSLMCPTPFKVGSILWEVCFLHSPLPSGFMSSQILSIQLVVCFCELFLSPTSCWALAEGVPSLESLTVACAVCAPGTGTGEVGGAAVFARCCSHVSTPVTFESRREEAPFHQYLICLGPSTVLSSLDEFIEESSKAHSESQEPIMTLQPLEPSLAQKSSNVLLKELTGKKGK